VDLIKLLFLLFCYIYLGRLPSVWDSLVHSHPNLIVDNSTGDVSANSYELYNEDIKALKEVGVGKMLIIIFLSFSIISFTSLTSTASLYPGREFYQMETYLLETKKV
jgi:hypothetical protein